MSKLEGAMGFAEIHLRDIEQNKANNVRTDLHPPTPVHALAAGRDSRGVLDGEEP